MEDSDSGPDRNCGAMFGMPRRTGTVREHNGCRASGERRGAVVLTGQAVLKVPPPRDGYRSSHPALEGWTRTFATCRQTVAQPLMGSLIGSTSSGTSWPGMLAETR